MKINDRLVDKLIASTALNDKLVPGLGAAIKGPIVASVGLDKIAENIAISNMAKLSENASHARPSMLASVSSFAENVRSALEALAPGKTPADFASLPDTCLQDFNEWQAMIAILALCNIYSGAGLKLSVQPTLLDGEDLVELCILREMDKDVCFRRAVTKREPLTEKPLEGYLYFICQDGQAFALYHPEIGICPMRCYDGEKLFGGVVDWYAGQIGDCHKAWKPIMSLGTTAKGATCWQSCLDDFCLSRIAWWAGQNGLRLYQNCVLKGMSNPEMTLEPGLAAPNSIENASNIDNVWEGKGIPFGTAMMFYRNAAGVPCPMPKLFLDNLLIAYTGGVENNRLVYNASQGEKRVCFSGENPELDAYAPVIPLSAEIMDVLEAGTLEEVTFDPVAECGRLRSVSVSVQISTARDSSFSIHKTYDAEHLRFGQLPYLMLWPFLPMPQDLWKKFYATWHTVIAAVSPLEKASGGYIRQVSNMDFVFNPLVEATKVYQLPNDRENWTVCTDEKPFRYAQVVGEESDDAEHTQVKTVGIVFMPKYPFYNAENKDVSRVNVAPVQLAVDFGTTSTVCALRSDYLKGGTITPLSFRDYSRAVTCYDEGAKAKVDEERWLGNCIGGSEWEKNNKIFSVAQLFARKEGGGPSRGIISDAKQQKFYVDGRLFLVTGNAIMNYGSTGNPDTEDQDPLEKRQIMNDMKFNEKLDSKNYHAASIFLAGIYAYSVLHLLSEKIIPGSCDYLELRVSYPNAVTMGALMKSWDYAKSILGELIGPELVRPIGVLLDGKKHFYSEAIATTAYQSNANVAVKAAKHLVSLDIGGGTTDISITSTLYPNRAETLSFRYAGREIMVSSLISYYRRFASNAQYGLEAEFKDIWEHPSQLILNKCSDIRGSGGPNPSATFLHSLLTNSSMRMAVELLLSEGMRFKPIAVSDSTNLIRQIITLKFLMVVRMTAKTVREHIDMWKDPTTGELNTLNNQMMIDLSISGTSAQLLQYVFDCSMEDLQALNGKNCKEHIAVCKSLLCEIFEDVLRDQLPAGVGVNLQIYVNANVKEKREVCYGMLQGNIDEFNRVTAPVKPLDTASGAEKSLSEMMASLARNVSNAGSKMSDDVRDQKKNEMKAYLANFSQEKLKTYIYGQMNPEGTAYTRLGILPCMALYQFKVMDINPNSPTCNRGLGSDIQNITDLLMNYSAKSLSMSQMDAAETRAAYMIEPEQEPFRDELACMYLVDELLDWEMIERQQ